MKKYVLLFLCLLMINTEIFSQDDFFEEKKEPTTAEDFDNAPFGD